ncbi:MAG: hypothetical protein D4S01_10455 [Dehalococcoidia bacterium]|nr:MAG: hypothetical protein D4S01_10455 [Dehalococcoidia bacterium]
MYDLVVDKCDDGYFGYCADLKTNKEVISGYHAKKKTAVDEINEMVNKLGWKVKPEQLKDKTV